LSEKHFHLIRNFKNEIGYYGGLIVKFQGFRDRNRFGGSKGFLQLAVDYPELSLIAKIANASQS
jgi:hypothetical protein